MWPDFFYPGESKALGISGNNVLPVKEAIHDQIYVLPNNCSRYIHFTLTNIITHSLAESGIRISKASLGTPCIDRNFTIKMFLANVLLCSVGH